MDKYVLVDYLSNLSNVICETFRSTKRIKLKSFDVSPHYIIFGASSGGIYIFKRKPCEFLRLIPSKEGPTIQVGISSNEKHLAIASSKGLVIILENFFIDGNFTSLVYNEHEGNTVTAMKWHGNDLYCGDDAGKISVFTMTSLLTKTIFQTSSATLMQMDSSIIQIDAYKNYLLISTRTRSYLCNTEKEQYKQIGKKLRDGTFGACFSCINSTHPSDTPQSVRGVYKTIEEDEDFDSNACNIDAKIYCARPGSRLWEANFEASVLLTHQFGSSLVQKPSEIVTIEDSVDAKLNIGKPVVDRRVPEQFNIGRIYPILQKFILTYDRDGLYFFEPETSMLSFWSYTFKNILDLRIVKSYIYIWREDLQMNIISLQSLECLLLTTLINKQYYLCSELCLYYNDDMNDLIEKSQKVHLLANLKTKLNEIGANDMLYNIKPILDALENHRQRQHIGIKLENGIVLVENEHVQTKTEEFDLYLPEAVLEFNNGHSVESEIANKDLDNRSQDNKVKNEKNKMIIALHKLYVLNKTHKNAELTETSNLYQNTKFEDILLLFNKFIAFVKEKDDEDATNWCQEQIIKLTAKGDFNIAEIDISSLQHLNNCFIAINKSSDLYCKCNIPLPKAHSKKIEHSNLAIKLFKRVRDKSVFLNNIPFLYKYDLKMIGSLPEVISRLPVITQFSDKEVFKEIKGMLTYDSWDEIIKWYLKLRRGFCLNCGEDIDVDGTLSWSELGLLMIESIGANNAIRLLKRYSQYIPKGELDAKFYQTCLFTPTCADQASAVNFMEKAVNGDNSQEFGEMIGNFIQKMYLGNHLRIDKSNIQMGTCPVCKLPVDTSVLIEVKKCDCGHSYHSICFPVNNAICNICITTS